MHMNLREFYVIDMSVSLTSDVNKATAKAKD